jgi:hypothetical protein
MIAFKSFLKIIVNKQAQGHYAVIINLANHLEKFGLKLCQSLEQIIQSFTFFTRFHRINHFIRKVDISLNQIHIIDKFVILGWHFSAAFRTSIFLLVGLWLALTSRSPLARLLLVLYWRELHSLVSKSIINLGVDWKDI